MEDLIQREFKLSDLEATQAFGENLGAHLKGGEVIELVSDLGGGKTTLVRSLAKGLGSSDQVSSPSFTLRNEYQAGNLTLYHFDFYRLNQPGIMQQELSEVIGDPLGVVVIEWANIVESSLPEERLTIQLIADSETSRLAKLSYPHTLDYLFNS